MKKRIHRPRNKVAQAMSGEAARRHAGPHRPAAKAGRRLNRERCRQLIRTVVIEDNDHA